MFCNGTQAKMARVGLGLTSRDLATELGMSPASIINFEKGKETSEAIQLRLWKGLHDKGVKFTESGVELPK